MTGRPSSQSLRIGLFFVAYVVEAPVDIGILEAGVILQLLDKMAVPVQPRREGT